MRELLVYHDVVFRVLLSIAFHDLEQRCLAHCRVANDHNFTSEHSLNNTSSKFIRPIQTIPAIQNLTVLLCVVSMVRSADILKRLAEDKQSNCVWFVDFD